MNLTTNPPLETLLLNEVKVNVTVIIGDASNVYINPSRGFREEKKFYSNIFTDKKRVKKVNLYSEKDFDLEIHSWVKADTDDAAREMAIKTDASIQIQILKSGSSILQYAQKFEQQSDNAEDIYFYDEGVCVAISRYHVTFRHSYGDPTQQNP
jgi:hypothetical protein